jgi:LysM domain
MVWESGNGGNFWTDEDKKIRLYARQRVFAAQQRRNRRLKRRLLWFGLTVMGVALAATVARSAAPLGEKKTGVQLPVNLRTQVVTVAPGDSLWSIARRYGPQGASTMDTVATISTLNGEITGQLEPGQRLVVPAP